MSANAQRDTLLLIDDEPVNLEYLAAILGQGGYRTIKAESGERGISVARKERPGLILLDVRMPGMDGFETCRRLKADRELGAIPVIFVSALDDSDHKIRGFDGGGADFLTKPVDRRELLVRVELHLERQRLQQQLIDQNLQLREEMARREAVERELSGSEERFRLIFSGASVCISMMDEGGNFLMVNDRCREMLGWSERELIGRSYLEMSPSEYREEGRLALERLRRGEGDRHEEDKRFLRKDGGSFWGSHAISALRIGGDGCSGFVCVISDLSERKQAEDQLRKLSRAVEQSHNTVVITDLLGRVEFVNPAFERSTGYSRDEVVGQVLKFMKPGDESTRFSSEMWQQLDAGEAWRGEFANRRRDGSLYWELTTISPVKDDDGRVTNYVAVREDITARKRAEEALRVAKQAADRARRMAEEASVAKSDFLATMSHEIRTPMSGVLGMTDLLLDSTLNAKQRQQVETIRRSGRTLIRIINDILDFSKIQAGKMALQSRAFDLREVIGNVADLFHDKAVQKGIRLHIDVPQQINPFLQGDPERLSQILYNLVGNAVKFTERGGISLKVSVAKDVEDDLTLRFDVTDTGIGISRKYRDSIFQAFSQEDGSVSRKYGGTGLGLVISRRLAILMGGELDFSSVEGKGSNFWFTANFGKQEFSPGNDYNWQRDSERPPARKSQFNARILTVEDNPINQQVAKDTLEMMGCEVEIANDGREALDMLGARADDFHLVLMDCEMPDVDGYEAARRWREIEQEQGRGHLPIVALTAHVLDSFKEKALNSGMDDFVSKPFSRDQLASAMRRWLPKETFGYEPEGRKGSAERDGSPLNHDMVRQLRGMDIVTLVKLYLEQAPSLLEGIFRAMEEGSHEKVRQRAHTLKSSSATMGAEGLAGMCSKIEEANRAELALDAVSLEELQTEFLLVCRALLELVEEPE